MKDKKKIPTLREMYQYISGKGSNASRHQMEKRMQKDPFVSDAMEGIEKVNKNEAMAQVNALNSIINHKKKSKTPFIPLAIAATIALLMVTTATLVFFKKWQEAQEPTLTHMEKKDAETAIEEISVDETHEEETINEIPPEKVQTTPSKPKIIIAEDLESSELEMAIVQEPETLHVMRPESIPALAAIPAQTVEDPRSHLVSRDSSDLQSALAGKVSGVQVTEKFGDAQSIRIRGVASEIATQPPSQAVASIDGETEKPTEITPSKSQYRVRGVITDITTGETVPFASINIKGTSQGAVADIDGSYDIVLPDSTKNTLVVSSVGYETQEVKIDGRETVNVAVNAESVALQEYIVIGYGTSHGSRTTGSIERVKPVIIAAVPEKGMDNFDKYAKLVAVLDDSFPAQSAIVKLRFIVNRDGRPTRIRVVSSPSKELSERAKQILLDGPDWIPATKDGKFTRERVEYSIVFKKKENK
jgi:hypothetical protein